MNKRNLALGGVLGLGLLAGGIVLAQNPPAQDIDPHRHPHLSMAQHHLAEAFDSINHAQQANDWDLQGHAAHAKDLIDQASREVKEAARASDHR
jgi:hypothetical protein